MPLAVRHRHDPAPSFPPLAALVVRREHDPSAMAALQGRAEAEMAARFAAGHRAYVALWEGEPAAWGWAATRTAEIGELASAFAIPPGERYLWNFVTRPAFRGLGIYPRLLDAIVRAESAAADRFWVAYAPENHASGSGIRKAGFTAVAELSFDASGRPALQGWTEGGASDAARVLGLPVGEAPLAPCWRCIRQGTSAAEACREGHCCCDYQRREIACAA